MVAKLSLNDVKKRNIAITVESQGREILEVEIQLPSVSDWNNAMLDIEFPTPPKLQRMKDGKKEDYQDFNDPEFLRQRAAAFEKLAMNRVTQALLGAGNFEELADMPLSEASDKLATEGDRSLIFAVSQALNDLMSNTKGGVAAKVAAFQHDTLPSTSDDDMRQKELVNR